MDLFYNQIDLPLPVILSVPLECENPYKVVRSLKLNVNECRKSLQYLSQLDLEAATLSRLIYRMKMKFRQEKTFKYLQMINRCLTNYKTMHLPFALTSTHDALFEDRGPSRQMLEWLLVRLYGAAKLFHRVYSLCIETVGHSVAKLKLGTMWEINLFCMAVTSRIWVMSQYVVRKVCESFNNLHVFLDKLPSSATPWLPEGCSLPDNLHKVLDNAPYLKEKDRNSPKDILVHVDSQLSETQKSELDKKCFSLMDMDLLDDIGERVSRNPISKKINIYQNQPQANNRNQPQVNNRNQLQAKGEMNVTSHSFPSGSKHGKPHFEMKPSNQSKTKNKLKKKRLNQTQNSSTNKYISQHLLKLKK